MSVATGEKPEMGSGQSMEIERDIGLFLVRLGLTLATAESCTGGLLAHRITNIAGSSAYFVGGLVTYANEVKETELGVRPETLVAHGAVSKETALEMARGARARIGADVSLSTTGIAGPGGGTQEKPVGLVYVGLSASEMERCERYLWSGGHGASNYDSGIGSVDERLANKEKSVDAALRLLLSYLQELEA